MSGKQSISTTHWDEVTLNFVTGRDGDDAAYRAALVAIAQHARVWIRRHMGERLHGTSAVEDVVQECLIAVHMKRETYDQQAPLAPWVLAIARYKLVDYFRARRNEVSADERSLFHEPACSYDLDSSLDIAALLGRLSGKQRHAIEHTKLYGVAVADVAQSCNQSVASIRVHVHRGLRALAAHVRKGSF